MRVLQVSLTNIACFDNATLDFSIDGKPCNWVILLGENGTGKSTILQMLALSLLGRDMAYRVAAGVEWEQYVRRPSKKGRVEIVISTTTQDTKRRRKTEGGNQRDYVSVFELGQTIRTGLRRVSDASKEDYQTLEDTLYSEKLLGGWFACGYGPWRKLPRSKGGYSSPAALSTTSGKAYRFATVFSEEPSLSMVSEWLADLDFRQLKEPDNEAAKRSFLLAIRTLEEALPGVKYKRVTSDREVIFEEDGQEVLLTRLSDGYRSTTAWVGDLIRRLVDAFPRMSNPLEAEGVVLIDEIDIHLHPRWQRSIVEEIRRLFPNLQFVVSSHSPFVAQDMTSRDKLIVLKRRGGRVVIEEGHETVRGWRADQILTSSLFGLEATRDESIVKREEEYEELLEVQAAGKMSDQQRKRLDSVKAWLHDNRSLPGETPDENEMFDAAQSMIRLLDEYLTRDFK